MKKTLIVTDVKFWEKSSGDKVRISALISYLESRVQLTVVCTGPAPENVEALVARNFNAGFFVLEKTKYLNSNGYGRKLKAFLKGRHFEVIIIEYIHSSYFLNFLVEDVKVILDAHDIISERADDFKKFNYAGKLYELSEETESEIFNVYDHVMVLCKPDQDKVTAMTGAEKALLCPHPVETHSHPLRKEVKTIAFVGSAYLPNRDAITWFIAECWPQISAKYAVELVIYGGAGLGLSFTGQQKITCKGFVADLDQIYAEADIMINPVRFGAGLKIKNVEALAHGLPLVTSSHGARGIEEGIGKAFLAAANAGEFIDAVGSLIESLPLRKKLSSNALKFIKRNFSADECFKPLLSVIDQ